MKTALYCCSSCHGKGVKHTHLYWHINCNLSLFVTQFIIISCYITRRVPLVEQELLSLPEHMNSTPVFSGVRVTRSLVLCACFVVSLFVRFSFRHCVVCLIFGLRILITPLVSSNCSCRCRASNYILSKLDII